MEVHLGGSGKIGGGVPDDGGINFATTEHGCIVYHYAITAITLLRVVEGTRGAGGGEMVGAGRHKSDRFKGSGSGSGGKG